MSTSTRNTTDFITQAEGFGAHNYHPLPVVLNRGEGCFVWDVEGKRYYDFLAAYSAVNQGHCHPKIVQAMTEQAGRLALTSRAFHNDRMGDMLEKIAKLTGFDMVLPMNTGAEGVETAIKAMRRWGYEKKGVEKDKAEIIVANGNFHGRTVTIVGFSDDPSSYDGYGPVTPGFVNVDYGDAAALEAAITPNTVGVMLEPIQGEAGVIIPPDGYLAAVKAACKKHNVVFCLDEIQTGLGRTGKMFCWEHGCAQQPDCTRPAPCGGGATCTRPDMIILGKALSGGLYPVSCVAANKEIMGVFTPGTHGSTYGGNPVGAACAIAALDVLVDENLCERAAELGAHALKRLEAEITRDDLHDVRGRGLMMAIEFKPGVDAHAVAEELMAQGLLAKDTHETTLRFAPPLVISKEDLDAALDLIIKVVNGFGK